MTEPVLEIHNTRIDLYWIDDATLSAIDEATSHYVGAGAEPTRLPIDDPRHVWDGWTRFLHRPKTKPPWVPTGLFERVFAVLQHLGRSVRVDDRRERPEEDVPRYLTPIPLFDYQVRAADACTRVPLQNGSGLYGQGVIDLAPRAGKTRILLEVHRRLDQPTIWIAPTNAIVDQTADVAANFFDRSDVVIVSNATLKDASQARLAIATAGAALDLPQAFYDTRRAFVLDEFHHFVRNAAWGREITKKSAHIYYRFGATGTHFRSHGDELTLEATLSRVLFKMTSLELLEEKRLVPTEVAFLPVNGPKVRGVGPSFVGGFGTAGLHEHDLRNRYAASAAIHLHKTGRTVLVIVGTKRQGYAIQRLIQANVPPVVANSEFGVVEFVSTDRKRSVQKRLLESFVKKAEVKILIGTSIVGEGVDLPTADALVWARGEKAAVSLVQGWFRVCTASDGKKNAIVVDFADRHHPKLLAHSIERLRIASREPIFRLSVLSSPDDFAAWVDALPRGSIREDRAVA